MIVKIFGIFDLLVVAIILVFQYTHSSYVPYRVMIAASAYLIFKTIMFFGDVFSIIDGIIGVYVLLMMLITFEPVTITSAIYLTVKGVWSILS